MSIFSLRDERGPDAAVEISGRRVTAVRLERRGAGVAIAAHAVEALPAGFLTPSLTSVNVHHRSGVMQVLTRALERIGRPRRLGLVLADPVAKVSLIRFQHVPSKALELEQLLRWQVKKVSPFPVEDAQLSYTAAGTSPEGREFLVTLARRDVIVEYESLCADAGAAAGLVDVSTSNVINAVLASGAAAGDRLLVNMAPDWTSLAVLRGPHVALLRSRAADGEESLADLIHQTAMYYEDRLNGSGFGQVLLCGAVDEEAKGAATVDVRREIEARLSTPVSILDATAIAPLADGSSPGAALGDALTPVVGLLMRWRKAAA